MAHACLTDEATEAQRTKQLLWGHRGGCWWSWGLSDQGILFVSSLCPFTAFPSPAGSSSPQDAWGGPAWLPLGLTRLPHPCSQAVLPSGLTGMFPVLIFSSICLHEAPCFSRVS